MECDLCVCVCMSMCACARVCCSHRSVGVQWDCAVSHVWGSASSSWPVKFRTPARFMSFFTITSCWYCVIGFDHTNKQSWLDQHSCVYDKVPIWHVVISSLLFKVTKTWKWMCLKGKGYTFQKQKAISAMWRDWIYPLALNPEQSHISNNSLRWLNMKIPPLSFNPVTITVWFRVHSTLRNNVRDILQIFYRYITQFVIKLK